MASHHRSVELRTRGLDSAALIKRIANGDESAFASLYDTTCGLIYGLLVRMLGNCAATEQVLVAVYQEAWKQAAAYDDEHQQPMTWLIKIAHSRALALIRADRQDQQRRTCHLKIAERTVTTDSTIDGIISERQSFALSILDALSPVQQQMIELTYFSGLRQNEIAMRLDLSFQSVQMEMRAGMLKLHDTFESHQRYLA